MEWDLSTIVRPCRLKMNGSLYIRDDVDKRPRNRLAIIDAKSLFNALEKEARGIEPRVGPAAMGLRQRGIPHNEQVSDPLAKSMGKSKMNPLLRLVRLGQLRIGSEKTELEFRQAEKSAGRAVAPLRGASAASC